MAYPPLPVGADFTDDTAAVGVHADRHNVTAQAVNEVVGELGPNPKGTFEHVQDRLDAVDAGLAVVEGLLLPEDLGPPGDVATLTVTSNMPNFFGVNFPERSEPAMVGGFGHYVLEWSSSSSFTSAVSLKIIAPRMVPWPGHLLGVDTNPLYFRIKAVDFYGNESGWTVHGASPPTPDPLSINTLDLEDLDISAAEFRALIKSPYPVVNLTADVATTSTDGTENDLQTTTLPAGLLATNGDRLEAVFAATCVGHATATRRLRLYFGGTAVMDTSALIHGASGGPYSARLTVVRVSASVVRCTVTAALPSLPSVSPLPFPLGTYTEVTGLTLANTQVLKATGVAAAAGAASGDIVGRLLTVDFHPAP